MLVFAEEDVEEGDLGGGGEENEDFMVTKNKKCNMINEVWSCGRCRKTRNNKLLPCDKIILVWSLHVVSIFFAVCMEDQEIGKN